MANVTITFNKLKAVVRTGRSWLRSVRGAFEHAFDTPTGRISLFCATAAPSLVLLAFLVYTFVYRQWYLIPDWKLFSAIWLAGVVFSFLFTLLESAVGTVKNQVFIERVAAISQDNADRFDEGSLGRWYGDLRSKRLKAIHDKNDTYITLFTVLGNLANVAVGIFVGYAVTQNSKAAPLLVDLQWLPWSWLLQSNHVLFQLDGSVRALQFFSVALPIIVFGKIVPKTIGRTSAAFPIVRWGYWAIFIFAVFGWIVAKPGYIATDLTKYIITRLKI